MLGCARVTALSHARRSRTHLFRPLSISLINRYASTSDTSRDVSSNQYAPAGDRSPPSTSAGPEPHTLHRSDVEAPASTVGDVPPSVTDIGSRINIEPWSIIQDLPGAVTPLVSGAGAFLLTSVIYVGVNTMGGIQEALQVVHATTGLPWWATIGVTTVGVKISLFPVSLLQYRHMDRLRMAWPEIQMLRKHLNDTLDKAFARYEGRRFPSKCTTRHRRTRAHPLGIVATPLVNIPVFIMFVWSIRAMLNDAVVPGLDTGGTLWFVDLTVSDSSLMLPVISTACTYTGLELSKSKGATGWIRWFQDGMQTFIILLMPWISTFPQGVFMYWIPSSAFQTCQTLAMKNDSVRLFFGLLPLTRPVAKVTTDSPAGMPKQPQAALTAGDSTRGGDSGSGIQSSDRAVKSPQS